MNKLKQFLSQNGHWFLPCLLLILIAPFTPWLDLAASKFFFDGASFSPHPFYKFMFVWGLVPAYLLLAIATIFLGLSCLFTRWKKWRSGALIIIFTVSLGGGLITNAILKDHWGRPRPRQIEKFGGTYAFKPFYIPNFHKGIKSLKSFPCGHATMGFCFFALYIVGRRANNKVLKISGLSLALLLGALLGWTRVAQGGHFLSDVLVSGAIMWWVAHLLDWVLENG